MGAEFRFLFVLHSMDRSFCADGQAPGAAHAGGAPTHLALTLRYEGACEAYPNRYHGFAVIVSEVGQIVDRNACR